MPTDEYDDDDRPRRPRDSREDDDTPVRRPRDDDYGDRSGPPRSDRGAGMGIASLVIGILALPCSLCSWLDIPLAVLAIIFGFVSRSQGGPRGTATAGIICGFIALLLIALIIALAMSGAIDPEKFKQFQQK
jgi:hypothetical protein